MVMIRSYERAMTNNERSGARVGCRGGPCRLVSDARVEESQKDQCFAERRMTGSSLTKDDHKRAVTHGDEIIYQLTLTLTVRGIEGKR